jgi:PAS domain S-box-containing protein
MDLTYYVPCSVRGRTIAYLGVSRTDKGDFLSSDDIELLVTLSGYVGIAVENARLYRSLQRKVEEYERLKEFSENIVESINVGILAADLEDRVESWNTQIERLTGISRESALGQRLSDLFPQELYEKFDQVRGETGVHNIYKFVLKPHLEGVEHGYAAQPARETVLNLAIAPLVSKEYRQIGRLIIFDDITDRAELESRLVQADKLSSIGLLAAGVAHEVNTPLAVISTYAQMLAKQVSGDEQKSKLLEKIAKQTFRASEIVNSLLNFSRTSSTDFADVDLNRVIRETLSLIEHQLQKAGVEPRVLLGELPCVKANAGKLQQVFLNLFLNARDAMPNGGLLAISTKSEDNAIRVEIADSGVGIEQRGRRFGESLGYGRRNRAGTHTEDLRSVLHHEGSEEGHRSRSFGDVWHHPRAWRYHRSRKSGRTRHAIYHRSPAGARTRAAAQAAGGSSVRRTRSYLNNAGTICS